MKNKKKLLAFMFLFPGDMAIAEDPDHIGHFACVDKLAKDDYIKYIQREIRKQCKRSKIQKAVKINCHNGEFRYKVYYECKPRGK